VFNRGDGWRHDSGVTTQAATVERTGRPSHYPPNRLAEGAFGTHPEQTYPTAGATQGRDPGGTTDRQCHSRQLGLYVHG